VLIGDRNAHDRALAAASDPSTELRVVLSEAEGRGPEAPGAQRKPRVPPPWSYSAYRLRLSLRSCVTLPLTRAAFLAFDQPFNLLSRLSAAARVSYDSE
jgi:hypothetical protein